MCFHLRRLNRSNSLCRGTSDSFPESSEGLYAGLRTKASSGGHPSADLRRTAIEKTHVGGLRSGGVRVAVSSQDDVVPLQWRTMPEQARVRKPDTRVHPIVLIVNAQKRQHTVRTCASINLL